MHRLLAATGDRSVQNSRASSLLPSLSPSFVASSAALMSRRPPEGGEDPSSTSSRRQTRRSSRTGASISTAEPTSSPSTARTGLTQPHPPLISSRDPVASSSSSSLGVGAGRAPREATTRRASRRASLDPYPTGLGESPEAARGSRRASRAAAGDEGRQELVEEEEEDVGMQAGAGEGRRASAVTATAGRPRCLAALNLSLEYICTDYSRCRTYELVIMQQPRVGAEAGMGRSTVGRVRLVAFFLRPCNTLTHSVGRSYPWYPRPSSRSSCATSKVDGRELRSLPSRQTPRLTFLALQRRRLALLAMHSSTNATRRPHPRRSRPTRSSSGRRRCRDVQHARRLALCQPTTG